MLLRMDDAGMILVRKKSRKNIDNYMADPDLLCRILSWFQMWVPSEKLKTDCDLGPIPYLKI